MTESVECVCSRFIGLPALQATSSGFSLEFLFAFVYVLVCGLGLFFLFFFFFLFSCFASSTKNEELEREVYLGARMCEYVCVVVVFLVIVVVVVLFMLFKGRRYE